jgi:hypothetical protein
LIYGTRKVDIAHMNCPKPSMREIIEAFAPGIHFIFSLFPSITGTAVLIWLYGPPITIAEITKEIMIYG